MEPLVGSLSDGITGDGLLSCVSGALCAGGGACGRRQQSHAGDAGAGGPREADGAHGDGGRGDERRGVAARGAGGADAGWAERRGVRGLAARRPSRWGGTLCPLPLAGGWCSTGSLRVPWERIRSTLAALTTTRPRFACVAYRRGITRHAASRGMRLFRPELTGSAGEGVVGRAHRRSQGEEARQQRQVPAGTAHPTPMTEGEGQAPTGLCVAVLRKHSTAGASARPILAVVPRPASSYRRAGDPAAACEGAAAVGSDEEGGGVGRAGRGRCGCHGTACWRWRSWWTRMSPSSMLRRARYTHAPHVFIDDPSTPAGYCLLACWHCPPEEWRCQCAPTADGVSLQPHPHAEEGGMNACPPAPCRHPALESGGGCGLWPPHCSAPSKRQCRSHLDRPAVTPPTARCASSPHTAGSPQVPPSRPSHAVRWRLPPTDRIAWQLTRGDGGRGRWSRQELPRATLDCVTPSVGLQAFAKVRTHRAALCSYGVLSGKRAACRVEAVRLAIWALPRHLSADTVSCKPLPTVTTCATCLSTVGK